MNQPNPNIDITPETLISDILENYPDTEQTLNELLPDFAKLTNPKLRETIAKVATLHKAAQNAGLPTSKVINTLRCAAGLEEVGGSSETFDKPEWIEKSTLKTTFDARSLIEAGNHPMNKVMGDLDSLADDESYCLVTPFVPGPLVDMAKSRGYHGWTQQTSDDQFSTYFARMLG